MIRAAAFVQACLRIRAACGFSDFSCFSFFVVNATPVSPIRSGKQLRTLCVRPLRPVKGTTESLRFRPVAGVADLPGACRDRAARLWSAWNGLAKPNRDQRQALADLLVVLGWSTGLEFRTVSSCHQMTGDWREYLGDRVWVRNSLCRLAKGVGWREVVNRLVDEGLPEFACLLDTEPGRADFPDLFCAVRLGLREMAFDDPLAEPSSEGLIARTLLRRAGDRYSLATVESRLKGDWLSAHLVAATPDATAALCWLDLAEAVEVDKRLRFVRCLIGSGAARQMVNGDLGPVVAAWSQLPGRSLDSGLAFFCMGVARGFDACALLAGMRLVETNLELEKRPPRDRFPADRFRAIRVRLFSTDRRGQPWLMRQVWMAWQRQPGFSAELEALPLPRMTNRQLLATVRELASAAICGGRCWRRTVERIDEIVEHLLPLGEEAADDLGRWLYGFLHWPEAENWPELWDLALDLGERHRRLGIEFDWALRRFWLEAVKCLADSGVAALRELPDSAFRQCAKALRSNYRAEVIVEAFESASAELACHLSAMLRHHGATLFDTLQLVGLTREDQRKRIMERYREHPAYDADPSRLSPGDAVTLADALAGGENSPVPSRLREHLSGGRVQSAVVVERDLAALTKAFDRLRLRALQTEVTRELIHSNVHRRTQPTWHTLGMANRVGENRRPLRRFLSQYLRETDPRRYIEEHPRNRRWLADIRSRTLGASRVWEQGFRLSAVVRGHGVVTLAFETDPEEILKMGTYAGSCLSLGGCNAHSAVSTMLDANKRVIYARDARDRVVARQLVVISKSWELLCFHVYQSGENGCMTELFHEFDRRLAARLALPIYRDSEGDSSYQVETLICRHWYDDGAVDVPDQPLRVRIGG